MVKQKWQLLNALARLKPWSPDLQKAIKRTNPVLRLANTAKQKINSCQAALTLGKEVEN
jgi:hypothetical protein